jgi:hypothetical protein
MSRSLDLYLEDIIEAIRKIHSYTSRNCPRGRASNGFQPLKMLKPRKI